jgi:membrane protein
MPDLNRILERLRACWKNCRDWLGHYIGGLYHRAGEDHIFMMSGGLAFSLFVCIIPLVLIVFAVLGNILSKPSIATEITTFIDRIIPYEEYAIKVKDLVFSRVDEFIIYKDLAGLFGIAGLLFAASGLFSGMRTVLNTVFRGTSGESVLLGKLRDLALVIFIVIYFLLTTAVLPGLDISQELAGKAGLLEKLNLEFLTEFAVRGFSLLLIFLNFIFVYFFIPYQRPPWKVIIVSALTATVLWHLAQLLFGFYLTNFVTLKRIYGAYFFLIVVGFWIYYTSLVFILGAEVGQLYRERAERRRVKNEADL